MSGTYACMGELGKTGVRRGGEPCVWVSWTRQGLVRLDVSGYRGKRAFPGGPTDLANVAHDGDWCVWI